MMKAAHPMPDGPRWEVIAMGLFDNEEELVRKANLKALEDKRLAFAGELSRQGFAPEKMLFAQTANGGFAAICRFGGKHCLIVSPGFGTDEDFTIERFDALNLRRKEVRIKSEGMGGIFGMGKKAEIGTEYYVTRSDGSEVCLPFVCGRNSWMECKLAKNPLLRLQRRRGDANVVWDLQPIDRTTVDRVLEVAETYFRG